MRESEPAKFYCPDCWKPYARKKVMESHRGSARCLQWREVKAHLEEIRRRDLTHTPIDNLYFTLQKAGIRAERFLCRHTVSRLSRNAWGYFVPRWSKRAAGLFLDLGLAEDESVALLRLGGEEIAPLLKAEPYSPQFEQTLAFLLLKTT